MPTIVPKRQASIGQRIGFSKTDSYKINTLYDCSNYVRNIPVPVAETERPITAAPIITPPPSPVIIETRRVPSPPTSGTEQGGVISLCRNNRPDCDQLARQGLIQNFQYIKKIYKKINIKKCLGWCTRNSRWMHDNCPVACGMCPRGVPNTIITATSKPNWPPSNLLPLPNNGNCEDLRVDCDELAKLRYCITAQSFTRTYCARSCGFCFVPPVTEIPEVGKLVTSISVSNGTGNENSNLATKVPMATFWPTLRPVTEPSPLPTGPSIINSVTRNCKDRKHFCTAWKKLGFCQGIFTNYMKKNCASSCGWC